MRIHVIRARTLPAALQEVRDSHGEDAIVLDTATAPDGVTVRVGVELDAGMDATASPSPARTNEAETVDRISEALAWHGVPTLVTRSLLLGAETAGGDDAEAALAAALDRVFRFQRPEDLPSPLAIVGPPGAGKTSVMAKLAAAKRMKGGEVAIVNADLDTAGARARIGAFAQALGISPYSADSPAAIGGAVGVAGDDAMTLIDTTARAPGDFDDIDEVGLEIEAAGAGLLVLSAAIAPIEAAELAECFAAAGAESLIVTQLDIARRVGALLAAADAGDLIIAGASLGRKVGAGLVPLTAASLARLILTPPQPIAKPKPRKPAAAATKPPAPKAPTAEPPPPQPAATQADAQKPEQGAAA